jgi:signal transduction histidine kinase
VARALGHVVKMKTFLAVIWCVFTMSMVAWWWVYAMNSHETATEILRKHRMFMWEGSIFLGAVVIGGVSLIFLSHRDQKRHEQLQTFFATFSHDIKTSITRLRLQAEVLEEDNALQKSPVLERLINDISRLDLQLENSLWLSTTESKSLLPEKLVLSRLIESVRGFWSELEFRIDQDAEIVADRRAIISVLRNLIQNAVLHGEATAVEFSARALSSGKVQITVYDNGKGFKGDVKNLGQQMRFVAQPAPERSATDKGNGIGLYLSQILLQKMKGRVTFQKPDRGFRAVIELPGVLL